MNRTVVRNFEPRVERRSDGQRGEHCDGVADHARNDQALCGGVSVRELGRVETLELMALVLAHLNHAEEAGEVSARVPMLLGIRDKLARALREEL